MDSQNGLMTHQPSAIEVSPGRGILKQDVLEAELGWTVVKPVPSGELPWVGIGGNGTGTVPAVPTGSYNGAGANIYTDLLM